MKKKNKKHPLSFKNSTPTMGCAKRRPDFVHATRYVRHMLAEADANQLAALGMTEIQRNKLLQKGVIVEQKKDNGKYSGAFFPILSLVKNATIIKFREDGFTFNAGQMLETAAHEQFHAASFWGGRRNNMLVDWAYRAASLGVVCTFPGYPTIAVCAAAAALNFYTDHSRYKEEVKAFRFGMMFNPNSRDKNYRFQSAPKMTRWQKIIENFRDYPSTEKRDEIRYSVQQLPQVPFDNTRHQEWQENSAMTRPIKPVFMRGQLNPV